MEKGFKAERATATAGGDPLLLSHQNGVACWYPMRVTYNRELRVKARLDELGIENYLPMKYTVVIRGGDRVRKLVPAVSNLIFVRAVRYHLTSLKYNDEILHPLRYMTRTDISAPERHEVMVVPDRQMNDFISVSRMVDDDRVRYLRYDPFLDKPGQRVRIVDGNFAGVEGVIKRIGKNRQVVVMIPGIAAITLSSIPCTWIEKI